MDDFNGNPAHQVISDSTVVELCERLLSNLGGRHHQRGFLKSSYILLLLGAPAADDAAADAYAEAVVLSDLDGTPIPVELVDIHRGYGISQLNPAVTTLIMKHVGFEDMGIPRLLTVLNSLVDAGTPGVECRAYRDTAVVILVDHREAVGEDLLVVEYIRYGGTAEGTPLPSMFTIRQCSPMEDTADDKGEVQHMIIPEGWYPLLPSTGAAHRWGHYDIGRMMPVAHRWGQQQVRGGKA